MKTKPFLTFKYQYSRGEYDTDEFNVAFFTHNKKVVICYLDLDDVLIIGKSSVHPDDQFDLETGISLAFDDAMKGFHKHYDMRIEKIKKEQHYIARGINEKLWKIFDRNESKFYREVQNGN